MSETPMDVLIERVQRLEREGRYWKPAACIALLSLAALGIMGQIVRGRVVEAESVVIKDAQGKRRVSLGLDANGAPTLRFQDKDGTMRAVLGLLPAGGPSLAFFDRAGMIRTELSLGSDGGSDLYFLDQQSRAMVRLFAGPTSTLELLGRGGHGRLSLSDDGVSLSDKGGKPIWKAP